MDIKREYDRLSKELDKKIETYNELKGKLDKYASRTKKQKITINNVKKE